MNVFIIYCLQEIISCCLYFLLFIFHSVLPSVDRLPFFRSPSLVLLSCSFT